jgi:hypothetical protein
MILNSSMRNINMFHKILTNKSDYFSHSIHQLVFLMDAHSILCDAKLNLYTDKTKTKVVFRDFKPDHISSQRVFSHCCK